MSILLGQVLRQSGRKRAVSDAELLCQYRRQRSESAFAELLHRYAALVWGVCRRMLDRQEDAEDAFQATFLVLSKKAGSINRPEQLGSWLYAVARHAANNIRRMKQRRRLKEQPWQEGTDMPDHRPSLFTEAEPLVDDELAYLPARYRLPLLLCCIQGLSHQQAADQLAWPVGTVAGRLSRGKEMLRQRLIKRGIVLSSAGLSALLTQEVLAGEMPAALATRCLQGILSSSPSVFTPLALQTAATTARVMTYQRLLPLFVWTLIATTLTAGLAIGWHTVPGGSAASTTSSATSIAGLPVADARYVRLPADPQAVVFRMRQADTQGDRTNVKLEIRSDGQMSAELEAADGTKKRLNDRLSRDELQQLAQFAVNDQEFHRLDADKIWKRLLREYEFEGDLRAPQDTITTEIYLRTADLEHKVAWYQLASTEAWFHDEKEIQQLTRLLRRLQSMPVIMQAGGRDKVNAVGKQLHKMLISTYPKLAPFEAGELTQYLAGDEGQPSRWTFTRGSKYTDANYFQANCEVDNNGRMQLGSLTPGPSTDPPRMRRRKNTSP